ELRRPLQFRSAVLENCPVRFGRTRPRLDRQQSGLPGLAGTGFHLQHSDRGRLRLRNRFPLEGRRRRVVSASFERRPNGPDPQSESDRAADWRELFVLNPPEENILVIRRALFDQLGSFQGLNFEPRKYLDAILSRGNNFFVRRPLAEKDPSHKQIIPY